MAILAGCHWQGGLPLLHIERGFGKAVHFPCLPATTIPINSCVPERGKPQRQIVAVEAFRVPAYRDNRQRHIAAGQLLHLLTQTILRRIGKATAQSRIFQPHCS